MTHDILVELDKRRIVGGQEDVIVDVTLDLVNTARVRKADPEVLGEVRSLKM